MSFNCLTSPKYQTSVQQKIHSRNVAKNIRKGIPELKSVLRQKFRQRLKDCRLDSYQNLRNLNQDQAYIKEVIRQELQELEYDINLQESIYQELLTDINEWLITEQDQEETYLESIEQNSDVFCPVCQKSVLNVNDGQCRCVCGASFTFEGGSDKLTLLLQQKINEHEQNCQEQLIFFVEPQTDASNKLNGMCDTCDFFLTT